MFEPDDLLLTLTSAGVEFVISRGNRRGCAWIRARHQDLDIVPDPSPENMERLASVLVEIRARHVGLGDFSPEESPFDPPTRSSSRKEPTSAWRPVTVHSTSCSGWQESRQTSPTRNSRRKRCP